MKIKDIKIKIILDSRGQSTLESEFFGDNFSVVSSIPAGKSKGSHEAVSVDPEVAIQKFEGIKGKILEKDFSGQEEFDNFLISSDGTEDKSNLGGNLILSLSMGFARTLAQFKGLELYQYISSLVTDLRGFETDLHGSENKFPYPIFNVINGGAHVHPVRYSNGSNGAGNKLDFQEFQIIPTTRDYAIGLSVGQEFYRKLGRQLEEKFGKDNISLGDEAGYSCDFSSNEDALEIIYELIQKHNYPLRIGLDMAASQFFKDGKYLIGGREMFPRELLDYYETLINRYGIISTEDPFDEESFSDFSNMENETGKDILIITDDLTTTNANILKEAIEQKSGNAILIKLTQIGTLTETLKTVSLAYQNNWKVVVSHRSGETMDDFIADLAVAVGAWGIKAGAPGKPERMAKYNRLLEIWQKAS